MISALLCFFENTPGLAAWVQAGGAIFAILGAYLVGERQASKALRNSQRLAQEEERSRRAAILEVAKMAMQSAQRVDDIFSSTKGIELVTRVMSEYHPSTMEGRAAALAAIPAHTLGSAAAAAALLDLRDQLRFLQACVKRWDDDRGEVEPENRLIYDNVGATNVRNHTTRINAHYQEMERALLS